MFKGLLHFVSLMATGLLLLPAYSSAAEAPLISFDASRGTLSTNINNHPLSDVMQQIAAQSGIKSTVMPAAERSISLQLTDVALEKALKQLLRGTNYAFTYQKHDGKYVVSGVRVLNSGEAGELPLSIATAPLAGEGLSKKDKESSPEHLRQQKIEAIKLNKLRRERKLPPIFISKNKRPPRRERSAEER